MCVKRLLFIIIVHVKNKKLLADFTVLQIGRLKAEFRLADFPWLLKVSLLKKRMVWVLQYFGKMFVAQIKYEIFHSTKIKSR